MTWTDARIEILRRLWAEGLSASQVAARIGDMSRNAVLGKVHRIGLPLRGKPTGRTQVRKPKPRKKPSKLFTFNKPFGTEALRAIRMAGTPLPPPNETDIARVSFMGLDEDGHRHCKWPVGNVESVHAPLFCGDERVPGLPYCSSHAQRAYVPLPPRRRPALPAPQPSGNPEQLPAEAERVLEAA